MRVELDTELAEGVAIVNRLRAEVRDARRPDALPLAILEERARPVDADAERDRALYDLRRAHQRRARQYASLAQLLDGQDKPDDAARLRKRATAEALEVERLSKELGE